MVEVALVVLVSILVPVAAGVRNAQQARTCLRACARPPISLALGRGTRVAEQVVSERNDRRRPYDKADAHAVYEQMCVGVTTTSNYSSNLKAMTCMDKRVLVTPGLCRPYQQVCVLWRATLLPCWNCHHPVPCPVHPFSVVRRESECVCVLMRVRVCMRL
jgi:hypothetical protein